MKKSFFQKSVARVAMPLGAVAVLAMIPMSSAFAATTVDVAVWAPMKGDTRASAIEAINKAGTECRKRKFRGINPNINPSLIGLKPIKNHTMYRVTWRFTCK